jgi:hypothetical protein
VHAASAVGIGLNSSYTTTEKHVFYCRTGWSSRSTFCGNKDEGDNREESKIE